MRHVYLIAFIVLATSCIPYKIQPKLKEDYVQFAKRFQRKLPKTNAYIFKDPKKANEFYDFIHYKFEPNLDYFQSNIPVIINSKTYYLSFYEVEKTTETINLIPILIDEVLEDKASLRLLETIYQSREGDWYLVMTVRDEKLEDALNEMYPERETVVSYLSGLKRQYLSTGNYKSLLLSEN